MAYNSDSSIDEAAQAITNATALLVTAGAGMGVDSGLPDFRGDDGFWKAYPPFKKLGLNFYDLADPRWFQDDPKQAWGFYGHRFNLYRATTPHRGFELLRQWGKSKQLGCFVFTSNVDGHFQQSDFRDDHVVECHGSFSHLQCSRPCSNRTWPAGALKIEVDESTMRAIEPLPTCGECGRVARPNILMFGDGQWVSDHTDNQVARYREWLISIASSELAIIEIGAGTAVPTVRMQSQRIVQATNGTLIRINLREPEGPTNTISIAEPGLVALEKIENRMAS